LKAHLIRTKPTHKDEKQFIWQLASMLSARNERILEDANTFEQIAFKYQPGETIEFVAKPCGKNPYPIKHSANIFSDAPRAGKIISIDEFETYYY
jgi:hypothetical protein